MNQMVANIISAMVKDPRFSDAIKEKIRTAVDTADMEKQLEVLQAQLRQALGAKSRLERQMDTLDISFCWRLMRFTILPSKRSRRSL